MAVPKQNIFRKLIGYISNDEVRNLVNLNFTQYIEIMQQ